MSEDIQLVSVSIMGRTYQIKCQADAASELIASAQYLSDKMEGLRGLSTSTDALAVIAALNIVQDYRQMEARYTNSTTDMQKKIDLLEIKMSEALA